MLLTSAVAMYFTWSNESTFAAMASMLYSTLYQKLGGHTVWSIRLLHCTRLLGTHGYLVGSGEKMVSGNLPIESGRAQEAFREHWGVPRLFFLLKNGNLGFWKPSESIGACSRLFVFLKNGNLGFWKVSTPLLRTHTVIRYTVIALHTVIAYPHGY